MRIGILGTGDVGKTLGGACITLGHQVMMGAREADNPKARQWAASMGEGAHTGTFKDASAFGELLFLCTLGVANKSVLQLAGAENLRGKILIDTTNPLDFSAGFPPKLAIPAEGSGGAEVQAAAPGALVVKAFNTVGNVAMFRPDFAGGPPDMFICGNSPEAKQRVSQLLTEFGWGVVDLGDISTSHYLEAMCMVWVLSAAKTGQWYQAFKLLRRS